MSTKAIQLFGSTQIDPPTDTQASVPNTAAKGAPANRRARRISVLAIGLSEDQIIEGITLTHAAKPRDVIEILRVLDFGLLLVSAGPRDVAIWQMIPAVRRYWPQLRWALLTENCTDEEEILARSLGAASVTADPRVIVELAGKRGNRK